MLPAEAIKLTPAPIPVTWIFAVDAIRVPAEFVIFPVVAVRLTAPAAVELVDMALDPKTIFPVAAVKLNAIPVNAALIPVDVVLLVIV